MKKLRNAALLSYCVLQISLAQVQYRVTTDKTIYRYGDTVSIVVSASNVSSDTVQLVFSSACQVRYYIDDIVFPPQLACPTVITYVKIPPAQFYDWPIQHPNEINTDLLLPGNHSIVGEVLEYSKTDTVIIRVDTTASSVSEKMFIIPNYKLEQNYPNPFNPTTTITYQLSANSRISLQIYDILGRWVTTLAEGKKTTGSYSVSFDGSELASGVYFARLIAQPEDGGQPIVEVKRMLMTK